MPAKRACLQSGHACKAGMPEKNPPKCWLIFTQNIFLQQKHEKINKNKNGGINLDTIACLLELVDGLSFFYFPKYFFGHIHSYPTLRSGQKHILEIFIVSFFFLSYPILSYPKVRQGSCPTRGSTLKTDRAVRYQGETNNFVFFKNTCGSFL